MRPLVPPVYRVTEHTVNSLSMMFPNEIRDEVVPESARTSAVAPYPVLRHVRTYEPQALIDKLICGAYIEARSCERFAALAPHVDKRLGDFYVSLLRSEARHYQDYLTLAEEIAGSDIAERVAFFADVEAELISSADDDFKFHSGAPAV